MMMKDRVSKSVYFTSPEERRLLDWIMDEDMPAKQISTFAGYVRMLMAREWERVNMYESVSSEKLASIDQNVTSLTQKVEDILYMLEGGIQVVDSKPPKPPTLPEEVTEAHAIVSELLDDNEEWD